MARLRFTKLVAFTICVAAVVHVQSCKESTSLDTISISLKNTDTYQYPTVGGDEDGTRISTQPNHSSISEIRRNAETNWVAVYVYRPAAGFIGSDYAELEILTGSDGARPPNNTHKVAIHFVVHD